MRMKMNDLKEIEDCGKRAYFKSLNLSTSSSKGLNYKLTSCLRSVLSEFPIPFSGKLSDVELRIDEALSEESNEGLFYTKKHKELTVELYAKRLYEYLIFEKRKPIRRNVTEKIIINDVEIVVSADLIFENISPSGDKQIEIVKMKKGKPSLTQGIKTQNYKGDDLELASLALLGRKLYPKESIFSSLYYLRHNQEKGNKVLPFELFKNTTSHDFYLSGDIGEIESRLDEATKILTNPDSVNEEPCSIDDCDECKFYAICNYSQTEQLEELKEEKSKIEGKSKIEFTENQEKVVKFKEGFARVNAGAGSGKTTVIANRVVELLKNGTPPEEILMITFTNKGAEEMREKIRFFCDMFGVSKEKVKSIPIQTFNAWGGKVVNDKYKELSFTKEPRLIDTVEQVDIVIDLLKKREEVRDYRISSGIPELNFRNPLFKMFRSKGAVLELLDIFDCMSMANIPIDIEEFTLDTEKALVIEFGELKNDTIKGLVRKEKEESIEAIYELYLEYKELLTSKNLIEYNDQINLLIKLIWDNPETLLDYQYQHIMIDEFQDSSREQVDIMSELIDRDIFKSFMVIGDDAQTIFGFRNASSDIMLNLKAEIPEIEDIMLGENFRSTPEIITIANQLNKKHVKIIEKEMIPVKSSGATPRLTRFFNKVDEYEHIGKNIMSLINSGEKKPSDIAVISRTNRELYQIRDILSELGIPAYIDMPEEVLKNRNVLVAINLVNLFSGEDVQMPLFEYLCANGKIDIYTKKDIEETVLEYQTRFLTKLEEIREGEDVTLNLKKFYFSLLESFGKDDYVYNQFIKKLKSKEGYGWAELSSYIKKLVEYEDNGTVRKDKKYEAVTLITAHSSKGKEYDTVFASITNYSETRGETSDERRLLFVVITRAMNELYLSTTSKYQKTKDKVVDHHFFKELKDTSIITETIGEPETKKGKYVS